MCKGALTISTVTVCQIKVPRILTLLAESHPAEAELKSEAQFQRLVASCSDLPLQPRTPRAPSDRGRYPEEADTEDHGREEAPSDDDDDDVSVLAPGFTFPPASEPINIAKPVTPAQSVIGDDFSVESPSAAMDVDIVGAVLFHRETFAEKIHVFSHSSAAHRA